MQKLTEKKFWFLFYESFWKGIYDISFWIDGKERKVEIKNSYPGFIQRIREAWMLVRLHLQYAGRRHIQAQQLILKSLEQ